MTTAMVAKILKIAVVGFIVVNYTANNFIMADAGARLKYLEEQLAKYKPKYLEAKRKFRGVRHEDSLSELRYTEFMVYKNMVEGLEEEIAKLKGKR